MKPDESQQNLSLALDMIYFLTKIIVFEHPNKIDMITELVEKWDARVSTSLRQILVEEAHILAKQIREPVDVASVMVSIGQQHSFIIKDEFKEMVKNLLIHSMMEETDDTTDVGP